MLSCRADRDKIVELQLERRGLIDQLKSIDQKNQSLEEELESKRSELAQVTSQIEVLHQLKGWIVG